MHPRGRGRFESIVGATSLQIDRPPPLQACTPKPVSLLSLLTCFLVRCARSQPSPSQTDLHAAAHLGQVLASSGKRWCRGRGWEWAEIGPCVKAFASPPWSRNRSGRGALGVQYSHLGQGARVPPFTDCTVKPCTKQLHLTLAHKFYPHHQRTLEQLARAINPGHSCQWTAALYSRDMRFVHYQVGKPRWVSPGGWLDWAPHPGIW